MATALAIVAWLAGAVSFMLAGCLFGEVGARIREYRGWDKQGWIAGMVCFAVALVFHAVAVWTLP